MDAMTRGAVYLAVGFFLAGCTGDITFASGLNVTDTRALRQRLEQAGISYTARPTGADRSYRLIIHADDVARAVRSMREPLQAAAPPRSIIPTSADLRHVEEQTLARALEPIVSALPQVSAARIHINLPPIRRLSLLTPPPPSAVAVISHFPESTPPVADIRRVLLGGVPQLSPEALTITLNPITPMAAMGDTYSEVGPFRVHPAEAGALSWFLRGASMLVATLAITILYLLLRHLPHRYS